MDRTERIDQIHSFAASSEMECPEKGVVSMAVTDPFCSVANQPGLTCPYCKREAALQGGLARL